MRAGVHACRAAAAGERAPLPGLLTLKVYVVPLIRASCGEMGPPLKRSASRGGSRNKSCMHHDIANTHSPGVRRIASRRKRSLPRVGRKGPGVGSAESEPHHQHTAPCK